MTTYINGRFLTQPLSGVQRYAREITRALDAELAVEPALVRLPRPRSRPPPDGGAALTCWCCWGGGRCCRNAG